jgi:uncharacterized CHY-type Zn-finger protein
MSLLSAFITRRFSSPGGVPSAEASCDDGTRSARELACDSPPHAQPNPPSTTTPIAIAVPTAGDRSTTLIDRFRRYSSFSRPAHDAVLEEDCNGLSTPSLAAPIAIPHDTSMRPNPSRILDDELRQLNLDSSLASAPATPSGLGHRPAMLSRNATTLSESLPADDGMAHLRARIHEIRELQISDQERARMVHNLMTERYNYMRPTSPSSFVSHDRPFTPNSSHSVFSDAQVGSPMSAASDVDPENPYSLRPGDTNPTYRPQAPHANTETEQHDEEEDYVAGAPLALGCQHYKRNVKVQCFECHHWYTCRHCHDAAEDHPLDRKRTQNMLCMACGTPQRAAEYCTNCQIESACYYCDICKLWDNNSKKKIYHCPDCGICRRGEGLGKDFYHCKVRSTAGVRKALC